jgi:hypothetical protein
MTSPSTFNLSPVMRRRALLVAGLLFTLWATWQVSSEPGSGTATVERTAPTPRSSSTAKPTAAAPVLTLQWPERDERYATVTDLFSPPPPPVIAAGSLPVVPVVPPLPVLKVKYMGRLEDGDNRQVFLSEDKDRVIAAKVGQNVADGWQLTAMDAKQLVFRHLATGHEQTMPIGTSP